VPLYRIKYELKQVAEREQRVNVRILTPTNDDIEEKLHNIVSETEQREIEIEERAKGRQEEQQQMKNKKKSFDIRRIDIEPLCENEEQEKEIQAAAVAVVEKSPVTTVTIVVVDRKESLVIEKTDDSKQNFIDAVGISTYSNSKPTVLSYISIFENLWKQTELYQDLKESTKQLELAYEQLKISDKMQGEFISAAAHELRTPIQPIISSVGIIRSRMGNLEVQGIEDSLNMITRNAERLSQLSSDILDVTKIESNSLDLEKEQLNLNEILLNTIEKHRKQITKANIDIIAVLSLILFFSSCRNPSFLPYRADLRSISCSCKISSSSTIPFIRKPIMLDDLVKKVNEIMNR
jgi:K+-sensing histidine kinase KdpD